MATVTNAQEWDCDADTYFADFSAVSNSMVKAFRRSPIVFRDTYVTKTRPPEEPTDAMIRGTLLHLLKLEPQKWLDAFVIAPEFAPDGKKWLKRKGSKHFHWWAEFLAECKAQNKIQCSQAIMDQVLGMAAGIRRNKDAMRFLNGDKEFSIKWTDEETGLPRKCRLDVFGRVIVDIKSCQNASLFGFTRTMLQGGYHCQAACYLEAVEALTGEDRPFVFIASEAKYPHRSACHILKPYCPELELGQKQNRQSVDAIAKCFETGDWSDPLESGAFEVKFPPYAFSDQYEIGEDA